ncbi:hypothetical protein AAFM48_19675 [Burkholderia pseudomallei]
MADLDVADDRVHRVRLSAVGDQPDRNRNAEQHAGRKIAAGRHAGQSAVDPGHQPFLNTGVLQREEVAQRGLRGAKVQRDRTFIPVDRPRRKLRSVSFKLVTADSQVSAWLRIEGVLIDVSGASSSCKALILARSRQKAAKLTKVHDHADGGRLDNVEVPVKIGRSMSSLGALKHGPQQPKPQNGPFQAEPALGLLARSTNAEASA